MADEQIIYLSPEEELTNVRERLEQVPSKRIILVIPQQTQLRSLVGWRLLHSRARELNKEILIISADRQIRSVVKAAGFRVADSLASTPSPGKSRAEGRPGRSSTGNKPTPHLRGTTNKGPANQQTATPDFRPAKQPLPSIPPIQPVQDFPDISDLPTIDYELETNKPRENEPTTRGSSSPVSPTSSSTFDTRNRQFGPNYDFRVGEVPPIHPLSPVEDEEDPDLWIEDIGHAQNLRNAAQQEQDEDEMLPPPPNMVPPPSSSPFQNNASFEDRMQDPLAFMDDIPSTPLPEQRGSVAFDDLDEEMPDISDYPTDVIPEGDIEDLGDQGNIVDSPRSWADGMQDDERDTQNPPRIHGMRPRSSRTGGMQPPPPLEDFEDEDEDELPPIYDQPTRLQPPDRPAVPPAAASRGSRTFSVAQNEPRPVALPQNRSAQSRAAQQKLQKPAPTAPRSRQPARTGAGRAGAVGAGSTQTSRAKSASGSKRKGSDIVISIAIGVLIFLIIGAIVYFVPSADVTVSVPFRNYSSSMTLSASGTSKQNATLGTVQAQTLTYDTSVSDKGQPTGTASVGNAQATGSVNFTNKSPQLIEIPTGMQLSTRSGVIFITTLDVKLPSANSGSSYTPPVTVQAQNSGTVGNVPANTIVSITAAGQQLLQQFNPGLASPSLLTVTNPSPTTGGGAGKSTALSTSDVNTLKAKLHTEAQARLSSWLAKQLHTGDQAGKPVSVETISTTPAVGTVITSGLFSETLKLHATVLVVRNAVIQSVASTSMNASVSKNKLDSGYTLFEPQQLNITQLKNTPSKDGSSLKLSFTAVGQIIPNISVEQIRNLLAGKRVSEVQSVLTGPGSVPGVVSSSAVVHPGFFPWLPFLSSHINVHIVPAQQPTTPSVHPTATPTKKK
ncbi:MAG: baseplate J/gp47 family protein [Ktedonobacteraceae bacterium]